MNCDTPDSHDDYARALSSHALTEAARDLNKRRLRDLRDPEVRWSIARRSAIRREIKRRSLTPSEA